MIYKFAQVYYLFVVKKVDTIKAIGYRKAARLLKVVFEAYRRDDKGNLVRCDEERIAQHFYQVFSNGYWHTQYDHDHRRSSRRSGSRRRWIISLDLEKRLNGRWIEGLPGSSRSRWIQSSRGIQGDSIPGADGVPPRPTSLSNCVDFGSFTGGYVSLR